MTKVILTGANGFVGHHILEHFLKKTDWEIYCLDKLSYASSGHDRIRDINVFNDERVKNIYYRPISTISRRTNKRIR